MTAYNGKTVSYDSIGSVTSYDGWDYTWSNRQLKQIKNDDTRIMYNYDANGLRTLKVVYDLTQSNKSETYRYMWKDGKISFVKYTDWVVTTSKDYYAYIIYDGDEPMGMLVNSYSSYLPIQNNTFLFVKNLQGDVIGIVDENGNTLVTYNYDAWGNVSCTVNSNFAVLGELVKKINPFTYRGYNYDYEIGLYYLQSRYYNPEWGRFISSDIYLETGTGVLGSNVFTYCDNNCVNKTDPEGTWGEEVHSGHFYEEFKSKDISKKVTGNYVNFSGVKLWIPRYDKGAHSEYYGTYYWAYVCRYSLYQATIIANACNEIDKIFSPISNSRLNQGWHFNVNEEMENRLDSRLERATWMILISYNVFEKAQNNKRNGLPYQSEVIQGLTMLGYALHPIQDIYAHIAEKSYHLKIITPIKNNVNGTTSGYNVVGIWAHMFWAGVDDVTKIDKKRYENTRDKTKYILNIFHDEFDDVL